MHRPAMTSGFNALLANLRRLLRLVLIPAFSPVAACWISTAQAQCPPPWICGDINGSGTVTSADVITLKSYTRGTGAPPYLLGCANVDDHELVTDRDVLRLAQYVFQGGPPLSCEPTQPPVICVPTTDYLLSYSSTFPANATSFWMDLTITAKSGKTMRGLHLPFQIRVGGDIPTLREDSIRLFHDSIWVSLSKVMDQGGMGQGDLMLQFMTWGDTGATGTHLLASVRLQAPTSALARPITLKWSSFHPLESGQPTGYPMLVDDMLGAWIPYGLETVDGQGKLSGTVYDDADDDCNKSPAEMGLSSQVIRLLPNDIATVTDDSGYYVFDSLPPGVYTVEAIPTGWGTLTCPASASSYTKSLGPTTTFAELDFAVDLQPGWDLSSDVSMTPAVPGSDMVITAMCINLGSATSPLANVEVELPPGTIFLYSESVGAGPGTYSPGIHSVNWSLGALGPGQSQTERLRAIVSVPSNTPLGTPLCATAVAIPMSGDADSSNNEATHCREAQVLGDPNAKSVSPQGSGAPGFIAREDTLQYHVDFQNTGSDTAFDMVVRDSLDPDLDLGTLQLGVSSHPYTFSIVGRELVWTFSNINLPHIGIDELRSHAFVEYSARPRETAIVGTAIMNDATVYFDADPPEVTNTVQNTICPTATPGDVNASGQVTSADVIYMVNAVFKSGPPPVGALGDMNCNGAMNSADIILLVNYVFKSGAPPCTPC